MKPAAGYHHHWAPPTERRFEVLRRLRRALNIGPAFDGLVGCGFGAIPWVSVLSFERGLPFWLVRKEVDSSRAGYMGVVGPELGNRCSGSDVQIPYRPRVIVLDDVISSGDTMRWTLRALDGDFEVVGILTIGSGYTSDSWPGIPVCHSVGYESKSAVWLQAETRTVTQASPTPQPLQPAAQGTVPNPLDALDVRYKERNFARQYGVTMTGVGKLTEP